MAAGVGLGLEGDVGSSLEVSRGKLGQRLFSLDGEWAAQAAGSGSTVPLPQEDQGFAEDTRQWEQMGGVIQAPIAH